MHSYLEAWCTHLISPPGGEKVKHFKSGYFGRNNIASKAAVPAPKL